MKERWVICLLAVVVVLFAALIAAHCYYFESDPVTFPNYSKIKRGMTKTDVKYLLSHDYQTTNQVWVFPFSQWKRIDLIHVWRGEEATVHVGFDGDGRVLEKVYTVRSRDR
jgi:hypothetical protein